MDQESVSVHPIPTVAETETENTAEPSANGESVGHSEMSAETNVASATVPGNGDETPALSGTRVSDGAGDGASASSHFDTIHSAEESRQAFQNERVDAESSKPDIELQTSRSEQVDTLETSPAAQIGGVDGESASPDTNIASTSLEPMDISLAVQTLEGHVGIPDNSTPTQTSIPDVLVIEAVPPTPVDFKSDSTTFTTLPVIEDRSVLIGENEVAFASSPRLSGETEMHEVDVLLINSEETVDSYDVMIRDEAVQIGNGDEPSLSPHGLHDSTDDGHSDVGSDVENVHAEAIKVVLAQDIPKCDFKTWHRKVYMGGYRGKQSQVEYFHAGTQTIRPEELKAMKAGPKFHRDSQTKSVRHRFSQSVRESSTQVSTRGIFISDEANRLVIARPYVTADEHAAMVLKKIIAIQCWVRRVYAVRRVKSMRDDKIRRTIELTGKERKRKEITDRKRRKEIESRLHPKTSGDFDMLYNGLEHWRAQESEKINNAGYPEAARLAALAELMDQEAVLIQKIDHLRRAANDESRERRIFALLDQMASPKRWTNGGGKGYAIVDTPTTTRARELRDLYHSLALPLLSIDERLQILLHVKYTVKEFDCNLTRDIVELIDREGDLVSRGRDGKSLEGLRKRICNLFLQFAQTPKFNPEAGHFQKYPEAGKSWEQSQAVYYCRGCTKYLPSTEFYLSTTMRHLGKCKQCSIKENIATERKDDSAYAHMLQAARIIEKRKLLSRMQQQMAQSNELSGETNAKTPNEDPPIGSTVLDLLQETDMRYLVDNIWSSQSAISATRKIETLCLTRWDPNVELSPWNCILLTTAEAAAHDSQSEPLDNYGEAFVRKVRQRHLTARAYFSQLPAMAKALRRKVQEEREKSKDRELPKRTPFTPPSHLDAKVISRQQKQHRERFVASSKHEATDDVPRHTDTGVLNRSGILAK